MSTEDDKRTPAEPAPEPVFASRDREPDGEPEQVEVVEKVEVKPEEKEPVLDTSDVVAQSDEARQDIYSRFSKKREEEMENAPPADIQDQEPVENEAAGDIIESDRDDHTPTPPDGDDEMVEVIVYGEARMVPQEKVDKAGGLQAYQKHLAVEEGLKQNAARARELDAREQRIAEQEQRTAQNEPDVPAMDRQHGQNPADLPSDDQTLEAMARQYQEAVYDGTEDAPSILANMVAKAANTGQTFDEDAFRTKVKEDLRREDRQSKIVKATQALVSEHPELNERDTRFDPRLFTAIDDETVVLEREHGDWEPEQIVREAYRRVSEWKGGHQTDTMKDKQMDKRELNRPRSGTQRFTPPPPEPRETNSGYVQRLREQRGLE